MDSKKDRITHSQALRLEKLCQALKGEGASASHLHVSYIAVPILKKDQHGCLISGNSEKVVWETALSIDGIVTRSEPWRSEDWVLKNTQEAFAKLCQEIMDKANHEVSKIDAQIDALRKKRNTITGAMDGFSIGGGWKAD
jgi:hypothetical protein